MEGRMRGWKDGWKKAFQSSILPTFHPISGFLPIGREELVGKD
jgi:hypothetical protein